jgi:hypothetical protein
MKKNPLKKNLKLQLHRETLHTLEQPALVEAVGGMSAKAAVAFAVSPPAPSTADAQRRVPLFGSCYALNPGSPALHTGSLSRPQGDADKRSSAERPHAHSRPAADPRPAADQADLRHDRRRTERGLEPPEPMPTGRANSAMGWASSAPMMSRILGAGELVGEAEVGVDDLVVSREDQIIVADCFNQRARVSVNGL